jgi:hypothetical protein
VCEQGEKKDSYLKKIENMMMAQILSQSISVRKNYIFQNPKE